MTEYGSAQVFQKLRNSNIALTIDIERLKVEREELNNELNIDRGDLNNVESAMNQLSREI